MNEICPSPIYNLYRLLAVSNSDTDGEKRIILAKLEKPTDEFSFINSYRNGDASFSVDEGNEKYYNRKKCGQDDARHIGGLCL